MLTVEPLWRMTLNRFKAMLCLPLSHTLIFTLFVILPSHVVDMLHIRKAKVAGYWSRLFHKIVTGLSRKVVEQKDGTHIETKATWWIAITATIIPSWSKFTQNFLAVY